VVPPRDPPVAVTLTTPRLSLRPFTEGDVDALTAVLTGRDVLRYFPPSPPPTRETAVRMIRRILGHWEEHGFGLWAVESRATGKLLGRCGLQRIEETGEVEADVILDPSVWGQGLATEAIQACVRYGVERLGLTRIVGIVHPEHRASQRVLEKAGLKLETRARYFGMDCDRYTLETEARRGPPAPPGGSSGPAR
jgi:ribosomal-protein-alanine N-acetyltransferase